MKISQIEIKRFGIWQSLVLPVPGRGLNVFYGPNEAGKTTLLRFIRGVLYGFEPYGSELIDGTDDGRWEGSLRADWNETACEIHRVSKRGSRGLVSVTGLDRQAPAEKLLSELLAGANQKVFENVFAVGLHELQELATLQDDDVARHIYGMTLGPDGQRLLAVSNDVRGRLAELIDSDDRCGELGELLDSEAELAGELAALDEESQAHAELCRDRDELENTIDRLKRQQADLRDELRGHLFLERVWEPWNQVRDLKQQLSSIPEIRGFPASGLERLDGLEAEIASAADQRHEIRARLKQAHQELAEVRKRLRMQRYAAAIGNLLDERESIRAVCDRVASLEQASRVASGEYDQALNQLGDEQPSKGIESVDVSAEAHGRLVRQARLYQSALARRARLKRHLIRRSKQCQRKKSELESQHNNLGGVSIDEAIGRAKWQIQELQNLGTLRLRETDLAQKCSTLKQQIESFAASPAVPKWVFGVLAFFGVAGAFFFLIGLISGVTTSWLAGLIYALLGLTCGGIAWALKLHLDGSGRDKTAQWQAQLEQTEVALRKTRETIQRTAQHKSGILPRPSGDGASEPPSGDATSIAGLIAEASGRLAELERVAGVERQLGAERRRLSELRGRFQNVRRRVAAERQNWCELLTQLGLKQTLRVDDAFQSWQRLAEAGEKKRACGALSAELQSCRDSLDAFRRRLKALARGVNEPVADDTDPLALLDHWETRLDALKQDRAQYRTLRRQAKSLRHQAARIRDGIRKMKVKRDALLVQGGASDPDEFRQRADWVAQRQDIEELLALADKELEAAAQTEPDLAVVEEDLLDYDAETNSEGIRSLKEDCEKLEATLEETFEQLGAVKKEIASLESDSRRTRLQFQHAEHCGELRRAAEKWFALLMADHGVEVVRHEFERTCQPAVLAAASRYLVRLTDGKYRNIWTPLGQRRLRVDDDRRQTFRVEQLSNGTREQLFLAIRLAMIGELTNKGIKLPIVLDDVLVNFDQLRTEAAIDTLRDFAAEGHQILLLTCHLHLAHLCENRGIEPTWLPGQQADRQERRAG